MESSLYIRRNISEGWQRGRGRAGRDVWRLNPQDFLHTTLKVLFIDPWEGEPVVGRVGEGKGEPEVGRGLGRGYGSSLGYLRDIRPLGHFPPPSPYAPCDPNPPTLWHPFSIPLFSQRPGHKSLWGPMSIPSPPRPSFTLINTWSSPPWPIWGTPTDRILRF